MMFLLVKLIPVIYLHTISTRQFKKCTAITFKNLGLLNVCSGSSKNQHLFSTCLSNSNDFLHHGIIGRIWFLYPIGLWMVICMIHRVIGILHFSGMTAVLGTNSMALSWISSVSCPLVENSSLAFFFKFQFVGISDHNSIAFKGLCISCVTLFIQSLAFFNSMVWRSSWFEHWKSQTRPPWNIPQGGKLTATRSKVLRT